MPVKYKSVEWILYLKFDSTKLHRLILRKKNQSLDPRLNAAQSL